MRDFCVFAHAGEDGINAVEPLHQDPGCLKRALEDVDRWVLGWRRRERRVQLVQFGGGADVEVDGEI